LNYQHQVTAVQYIHKIFIKVVQLHILIFFNFIKLTLI